MAEIAGLKLIVPSSVAGSGVSVSASGKVTFTTATSVSVNGCFSSSYDNYLVVSQSTCSVDVNGYFRLRSAGTDATTNYTRQILRATGASVSGLRGNDAIVNSLFNSLRDGNHFYVYGPFLAQATAVRSVTVGAQSDALIYDTAMTHSTGSSYDGFSYFPGTGNITGTLTVYGLSQ
jgi:hypothetical protein